MSTSIRPPGGPTAPAAAGIGGASEIGATEATAVTDAGAAQGVGSAQPAAVQSPTELLLSRLQAGELTREQAIDGLVSDALATHGGARLPPLQRSELEAVLRAALLDDPALARLLG